MVDDLVFSFHTQGTASENGTSHRILANYTSAGNRLEQRAENKIPDINEDSYIRQCKYPNWVVKGRKAAYFPSVYYKIYGKELKMYVAQ